MMLLKVAIGAMAMCSTSNALRIGFVGDTGAQTYDSSFTGKAVFQMFQQENVDIVIQNGDLDYDRDPTKWDTFLNDYASGMDVLVSSGNHEERQNYDARWYGEDGYKAKMYASMSDDLRSKCTGRTTLESDYGEYMSCTIDNSLFVMVGWAQMNSIDAVAYVEGELSKSEAPFKFCVWHRPEGRLNPGDKHTRNYGTQAVYEVCRKHGAMITSGHSHVYGRSRLLSGFSDSKPNIAPEDSSNPKLDCGRTISFVVGMGGYKFDGDGKYASDKTFRNYYTEDSTSKNRAGGLICDTGSGAGPTMSCKFQHTKGRVIDSFDVERAPINCDSSSNTLATTGICEDSTPSGLLFDDGREAKCSDVHQFCGRIDVSSACPKTCGLCGDPCFDLGGLHYTDGTPAECSAIVSYCEREDVSDACQQTCGECTVGSEFSSRSNAFDKVTLNEVVLPFSVAKQLLPEDIENPNPPSKSFELTTGAAMGIGIGVGGVAMLVAVTVFKKHSKNNDQVIESFAISDDKL